LTLEEGRGRENAERVVGRSEKGVEERGWPGRGREWVPVDLHLVKKR
jgi:hypothetical protein